MIQEVTLIVTLFYPDHQITVEGVTGTIKFDENGFRSDFKLRLQEVTREGLRVVGHWNTTGVFFMPNYTKAMAEGYRQTLKNRTLTVVTKIGSPYAMEVDNWREQGLVSHQREDNQYGLQSKLIRLGR